VSDLCELDLIKIVSNTILIIQTLFIPLPPHVTFCDLVDEESLVLVKSALTIEIPFLLETTNLFKIKSDFEQTKVSSLK
jgi:hypothetical protein